VHEAVPNGARDSTGRSKIPGIFPHLATVPVLLCHPFPSGHTYPFKLPHAIPGAPARGPPLTFNLGPDGQDGRVAAFAPADRSCGAPRPLPDAVPRARDPCRPVASAEPSDRLSMRAWTSPVYAPVEREHRSPLAAAAFARRTELRRDTSACTRANTSFGETGLPSLRPIGAAAQIDALLAVPDVVDPWGVHARCHPSAQCRRRHCPKERR